MLKAFPFLLIPFLALPVNATIVQTLPSDTLQRENDRLDELDEQFHRWG